MIEIQDVQGPKSLAPPLQLTPHGLQGHMEHRSEAYGNTNYLTVAIFKFRPMTQDIGVERGWGHGPSVLRTPSLLTQRLR